MKLLLCAFLIISFVYLGSSIVRNIKKKKILLEDVVKLCNELVSNINFGQKKIIEIIQPFCENCCSQNVVLEKVVENLKNNKKVEIENVYGLSEYEVGLLKEFFNGLGDLDSVGESSRINNFKQRFEGILKDYSDKYKQFGPLIIKLSLIFGVLISIVLI